MKLTTLKRMVLCSVLLFVIPVHAQPFTPTLKPVTPELRQKLRRAALETQAQLNQNSWGSNMAVPLAMLGDWDTALRLAQKDTRAPRVSDKLWAWRTRQLALASKWREAGFAASQIKKPSRRMQALLYAAHAGIERGIMVADDTNEARQIKELLLTASSLRAKDDANQTAYDAYLWARGGDYESARRVFDAAYAAAKTEDDRRHAKATPEQTEERERHISTLFGEVLSVQANAGMWSEVLRHAAEVKKLQIDQWMFEIPTRSQLLTLSQLIEKQNKRDARDFMFLSIIWSINGDKKQARTYYEKGRQVFAQLDANSKHDAEKWQESLMASYVTAQMLGDETLIAQNQQEMQAAASHIPELQKAINEVPIELWPAIMKIQLSAARKGAPQPLSPAQLDELSLKLRAAPASDQQFYLLVTLADYCSKYNLLTTLRSTARAMAKTARALSGAEMQKRKNAFTSFPYGGISPKTLTAIEWLQKAGETSEATFCAREFARTALENERATAALDLLRLGYPEEANSAFNLDREAPNWKKWQTRRLVRSSYVPWSDIAWSAFAAEEARQRSSEAPLRWFSSIKDPEIRADILGDWVAALYPQPEYNSP